MSLPLQQGRIAWFTSLDPNGQNEKKRPCVVLTPGADIREDGQILVAAISSSNVAPPSDIVRISWNRDGTTSTRLRRVSHVVCNWLALADASALESTAGQVNPRELVEILAKVAKLNPADGETTGDDSTESAEDE